MVKLLRSFGYWCLLRPCGDFLGVARVAAAWLGFVQSYGPVVAEGQEEASHVGMGAWGRSSAVWDRGQGRKIHVG